MNTIAESSTLPVVVLTSDHAANRAMLMALRKSYLDAVDAIERCLGLEPRTAEIRAWSKRNPISIPSTSEGKCNSA